MGILYIVATPLGNLEDVTLRALRILKETDLVVCEDTRQTLKLLSRYDIQKPLVSYFQHSKISKIEYIASQLNEGKNVALVTDAGTPGISDPGGVLIEELLKLFPERAEGESKGYNYPSTNSGNNCLRIVPIPGPNAAIAALSISGFPTDKFVFMGFPPHKKGREKYFKELAEQKLTVVFYESTHRILKALAQLKELLPERPIVVCRELTKQFESVYRGTAGDILKILESNQNYQKGEFVIILKNE